MMSDEKVIVRRANVVLRVSPQQADYYLSQGYSVINDEGKVIRESIPRDLGTLQKAFVENSAKIKEFTAEVDTLKATIEELQKQLKSAKKQSSKVKTDAE